MRAVRAHRDSAVTVDLVHGRVCQIIDNYAQHELFEVTQSVPLDLAENTRRLYQAKTASRAREALALLDRCCRQAKSKSHRVRLRLQLRAIRQSLLAPEHGLLTHDQPNVRPPGKPSTRAWRRRTLPTLLAIVRGLGYKRDEALELIAHQYCLVWSARDAELTREAFRQLWSGTIQRSTPLEQREDKLFEQLQRQLSPRTKL